MSRIEERSALIVEVLVEERGDTDVADVAPPRPTANDYGTDLIRQRLLAGVWRA
jgi:hypothetical protein